MGLKIVRGGGRGRKDSNNNKFDMVEQIMTRHSGVQKKGVSAKSVKEWSDELKRSRSVIRKSDPNLILLELEKIQRGMAKYKVPALGYIKLEKPEGVYRFMVI